MEFMGYVRPDGKVGARNYVAVIPSVTLCQRCCQRHLPPGTGYHYISAPSGCCQMPPDLERVTDTLISLGMSPTLALS